MMVFNNEMIVFILLIVGVAISLLLMFARPDCDAFDPIVQYNISEEELKIAELESKLEKLELENGNLKADLGIEDPDYFFLYDEEENCLDSVQCDWDMGEPTDDMGRLAKSVFGKLNRRADEGIDNSKFFGSKERTVTFKRIFPYESSSNNSDSGESND